MGQKEQARAAWERALRESGGSSKDYSRQEPSRLLRGLNAELAWSPGQNLYDDKEWMSEVAGRFGYTRGLPRLPRTILVDRRGIVRAVDLHGAALDRAMGELVTGR